MLRTFAVGALQYIASMRALLYGGHHRVNLMAVLLASIAADAGCGGIDESQFTVDVCAEDRFDIVAAVAPAMSVDYLDLRGDDSVLDAIGAPCSGASDEATCRATFDALPWDSEFVVFTSPDTVGSLLLAFTRTNEVGRIATPAELDAFLGPIDAPGDAALVVILDNPHHRILCRDGGEVGPHDDGFVVFTRTGLGCGRGDDVENHAFLVRSDGSTEVLESELVERGKGSCSIP